METTLHAALARSPMPTGVPLSELVKWMHDRIRAHQESTRRWRANNPETARICASNLYHRDKPRRADLPDDERRRIKAAYMKEYRAKIRLERQRMEKKIKAQDWDKWRAQKQAEAAKRKAKWLRRMRKRGLA